MYSSNRAYEVAVHVRGRPVKEVHHRGRTYIEGRKGTEYTLHFRSQSSERVLVIPSVDGLCVIDGKPAGKNSPGFIVEPRKSIDIPGWMVDSATAAQFTFWPQDARGEASYVEELSKSGANVDVGNQGLIGFMVLAEHFTPTLRLDGYHSPTDLNIWKHAGFATGASDGHRGICASAADTTMSQQSMGCYDNTGMGTKFGDATEFNTRSGTFNRGSIVAEFVIEYDTLRGLKDRGVSVDLFKGKQKRYGERTAFPNNAPMEGCEIPDGWEKNAQSSSKKPRRITQSEIQQLHNIPKGMSMRFFMKHVLQWPDEMIEENEAMWKQEQ